MRNVVGEGIMRYMAHLLIWIILWGGGLPEWRGSNMSDVAEEGIRPYGSGGMYYVSWINAT